MTHPELPVEHDEQTEHKPVADSSGVLRELAHMTLTGRNDIRSQPYLSEDYAVEAIFGSVDANAESKEK
ncbi:MAG: hypothetical protein ABIR37_00595 [Candidatus Saccharimonadales bacterium]